MKKYIKLWVIWLFLFFIDILSTYMGVWVLGYYELNPIVRSLYLTGNFFGYISFSFISIIFLYGIVSFLSNNLSSKEKERNEMKIICLLIMIIQWFTNDILNILTLLHI